MNSFEEIWNFYLEIVLFSFSLAGLTAKKVMGSSPQIVAVPIFLFINLQFMPKDFVPWRRERRSSSM
jgi:hypothetical protein